MRKNMLQILLGCCKKLLKDMMKASKSVWVYFFLWRCQRKKGFPNPEFKGICIFWKIKNNWCVARPYNCYHCKALIWTHILDIQYDCYVSTHRHFLRAREVKNFIQMAHRSVLYYRYPFPLLTKCRKYSVWLFLAKLKKIQGGPLLWIFKIWAIKKSKGRPLLWISKLQSLEKKEEAGTLTINFPNLSHFKKK